MRWLRWVEPWYCAYAVVGLMVLGVAPIFLPVSVEDGGTNGATSVGIVVAAFYVGGLFAPVLGSVADRTGRQRIVFLSCFPLMAITVAGFAFANEVWLWAILALLFGGAGSLAGTVAGLFVVEAHPKPEWNDRISWFRLAYGAGQVIGLLIAAVLVSQLKLGWLITAAVLLAGLFLAQIRLPKLQPMVPGPDDRLTQPKLLAAMRGRFGIFLLAWLLTMVGVQTFFNVVPLIMRDAFSVSPSVSSILFLVGAGIGTLAYPLSGKLADLRGPGVVLVSGLLLTAAAFGVMALVSALDVAGKTVIGSVALVVAAIAYSFLVVSATMMIVVLIPGSEGSAMGLLNGVIAAGAVIGAIAPSFLAKSLGYEALPALACGVLVVALLVGIPLYRKANWFPAVTQTPTRAAVAVPGRRL